MKNRVHIKKIIINYHGAVRRQVYTAYYVIYILLNYVYDIFY